MFAVPLLVLLALAAPTTALTWSDLSNNLASDLSPLLTLFGEQVTRQYLGESVDGLDFFIFAVAPLGILTALTAAIRVSTFSTRTWAWAAGLRAFIGRAHEGAGAVEADVLGGSTGPDVGEVFNINGGVARVQGRPKMLEFVWVRERTKSPPQSPPQNVLPPGLYLAEEYFSKTLTGNTDPNADSLLTLRRDGAAAHAPNLSLNLGINGAPVGWAKISVAMLGAGVQVGALVWAAVATYLPGIVAQDEAVPAYACPCALVGTALLSLGAYLCASIIGDSAQRVTMLPPKNDNVELCFLQPGGQTIGDQGFGSFFLARKMQMYSRSWRRSHSPQPAPIISETAIAATAVGATVIGFILQFVGLRGLHASAMIAQLGVTVLMGVARSWLRVNQVAWDANLFRHGKGNKSGEYTHGADPVGHELDWLATYMAVQSHGTRLDLQRFMHGRFAWQYLGEVCQGPPIAGSETVNLSTPQDTLAAHILAYRARLAELSSGSDSLALEPNIERADDFRNNTVAVRAVAKKLAKAMTDVLNKLWSPVSRIEWKDVDAAKWRRIEWRVSCAFGLSFDSVCTPSTVALVFELGADGAWTLASEAVAEALLSLRVWSVVCRPQKKSLPHQHLISCDGTLSPSHLSLWVPETTGPTYHEQTLSISPSQRPPNAERFSYSWLDSVYRHTLKAKTPPNATTSNKGPSESSDMFGWYAARGLCDKDSLKINSIECNEASGDDFVAVTARDIFGSFLAALAGMVNPPATHLRVTNDSRPALRLENQLVSSAVSVLKKAGIGSPDTAAYWALPALIRRLKTPDLDEILQAVECFVNASSIAQPLDHFDAPRRLWTALVEKEIPPNAEELTRLVCEHHRRSVNPSAGLAAMDEMLAILRRHSDSIAGPVSKIVEFYKSVLRAMSRQPVLSSAEYTNSIGSGDAVMAWACLSTASLSSPSWGEVLCASIDATWTNFAAKLVRTHSDDQFVINHRLNTYGKNHGKTPLCLAAAQGQTEIVSLLLSTTHADPNLADTSNCTPLWHAVSNGHIAVIERLLTIDSVHPDSEGGDDRERPLAIAAAAGNTTIVGLLLSPPTRVFLDAQDVHGRTALMRAIDGSHVNVVKMLVAAGAKDPSILSHTSATTTTTMATIIVDKDPVLAASLIRASGSSSTPIELAHVLVRAIAGGHLGVVGEIRALNQASKIGAAVIALGRNPILIAVDAAALSTLEVHRRGIIEILLSMSLDPNLRISGERGLTPLMLAASRGHLVLVKRLLDAGADLNAIILSTVGGVGYSGTALDFAGRKEVVGRDCVEAKDVVQELRMAGAKTAVELGADGASDTVLDEIASRTVL